jgi:hypothetical protein
MNQVKLIILIYLNYFLDITSFDKDFVTILENERCCEKKYYISSTKKVVLQVMNMCNEHYEKDNICRFKLLSESFQTVQPDTMKKKNYYKFLNENETGGLKDKEFSLKPFMFETFQFVE